MKLTTTALGLVLALGAAPLAAQTGYNTPPSTPPQTPSAQPATDTKQAQIQPSRGALKAIVDLQAAINKQDYASVPALAAAAMAVAKTKEDRYLVGRLEVNAGIAAKDNSLLAAGIDAIAGSGFIDSAKVSGLYMGLGSSFYNAKDYARAQAAFERAASLAPQNPEPLINVAETHFAKGEKAAAVTTFEQAIQASLAAGRKPGEEVYKRTVQIAYDAQLPSAVGAARQWVAAYPNTNSWHNAIAIYRNMTKPDVEGTLALLRLMQVTNSLEGAADYSLFATAAADQSNYNEAKAVIDQGIAAGQVDPTNPLFKDIVAGLKTKPIATDADLAAALKMAPNGLAQIRIGDRYYGLGLYAKAAEVYRAALGKPGIDPNIVNLHLGMALARAGDKAGATGALNAVTGPRAELAKFWLLYLSTKG